MKKNVIRIISAILIFLMLFQTAFASDKEITKDYSAKTISRVPKQFQRMVNGNWAVANGEFGNDGYFKYNQDDGKIKIKKYNIYGEKLYETEYAYKYAGKDKESLFYARYCMPHIRWINKKGDVFYSTYTIRTLPLLKVDFSSKVNLVKVDSKGNVVWQKDFKSKEVYLIRGMVETEDGSLILGVTRRIKWVGDGSDGYQASLIKLSADGEVINQVDLTDGTYIIDNLAYVAGKGFFAMTSELTGEDDVERINRLSAFNDDFELLWEYEIDGSFYPWNKETVSDYGYPILKKSDEPYSRQEKTLIRLDLNKNVVSKNTFKTSVENEYIGDIFILDNGEFIVEFKSNNENNYKTARFIHYSKDNRNLGEVAIQGYKIEQIIETKEERIFCCTNTISFDEAGRADEEECVYTAFDKDWNLLWQKGTKKS